MLSLHCLSHLATLSTLVLASATSTQAKPLPEYTKELLPTPQPPILSSCSVICPMENLLGDRLTREIRRNALGMIVCYYEEPEWQEVRIADPDAMLALVHADGVLPSCPYDIDTGIHLPFVQLLNHHAAHCEPIAPQVDAVACARERWRDYNEHIHDGDDDGNEGDDDVQKTQKFTKPPHGKNKNGLGAIAQWLGMNVNQRVEV
ncbi:hypothetical protein BD410DRAFT_795725 [Rickenella mellea]|uniref:Uncharacterized protein n=1 Tax=Rickenella mellea TaxID=50990 RepID=A0A4Y7PKT2_9AGAM|nr:hypothetical protein BD410DRAFT_795725 [Rickenella mellea]